MDLKELLDVEAALELRNSDGKWADLFRGTNRRRTIISWVIPIVEGWQGLSFMGNYLIVFLISLGATNQYFLSLMLQLTIFFTSTLTFWAPDRLGRRPMLILGAALMFLSMYITAGVSGQNATGISNSRKQVAVGFLFVWAIAHAGTWQTLGYTAPAEIPTTKLRSKTGGMAYLLQQSGGLIVTFVSPYMQNPGYGNMGAYIGFFFGSFSLLGVVFVYFCYPETKGLSIERLDVLFEQKTPTRDFKRLGRSEGTVAEMVIDGLARRGDVKEVVGETIVQRKESV